MELRDYQKGAVTATVQALREGLNPVAQLPTGAGKSAAETVIPTVRATLPTRAVGIAASSCWARRVMGTGDEGRGLRVQG